MDAQLNTRLLDGEAENAFDKEEDPRTWNYKKRQRELTKDLKRDT